MILRTWIDRHQDMTKPWLASMDMSSGDIPFKPNWTRHAKAASFKRNDELLTLLPIGVLVFPGSGIQENLADKAKNSAFRSGASARAAPKRAVPNPTAVRNPVTYGRSQPNRPRLREI